MCKALSSEKQVRFAPFGESKLTEVLQDVLGGNAIVICISCLSRSDSVKVLPLSPNKMCFHVFGPL